MSKRVLGIIPARGGSKGVKRKNVRLVGDKPLIYWSITCAKESQSLSECYVTTDDREISEIAESFGIEVIARPDNLAMDKTPMIPVLQHLCLEAENMHGKFDYVLLLQPTAPMRRAIDIDSAISSLVNSSSRAKSLLSVYQVEDCHPSRMYLREGESLVPFYEEPKGSLRQDLTPVFHRNGAIYLCERDLLMESNALICDNPLPYIMSKADSVNIDDEEDLLVADFLMTRRIEEL